MAVPGGQFRISNVRGTSSFTVLLSAALYAVALLLFWLCAPLAHAAPVLPRIHPEQPSASVERVHHIAPYTCGVTSSKFARICRPSAQTSCKGAVTRGVKGYSQQFCAARHTACVSCLAMLKRCINQIGHGKRADFSCEECTGKFSRCIGKRYPVLAR